MGKPVVIYNNIYGNVEYDFRATLQASDSIDAKYNWWGTADRNEIISKIYDFYDDGVTVRVRIVLVDTLVEYSDSVRISYSLIDTSRDVLRFRGYN